MIQPESVCLLIADISGYTEYLSTVEIDHAQDILADLIGTVVTSLKPNFRLAKLEGDAAFCFAPAEKIDGSVLLDTIEHCYFSFRRRRRDVRQATSCECNACMRIPNLNLKFVAHHGLAIRQKMAGREELLGADVIVVHRLLKNDIVEKLEMPAYAAFTDKIVQNMGLDPVANGMREHSETYEHVGELKIWVHDLEARWQQEEERKRVYIGPEDPSFAMEFVVDAPPQVVWEFLTTPGRRKVWQAPAGITEVNELQNTGGRRGVGTVNHCMHGPDAVIEEILDWRPFDYYSDKSIMPGGAMSLISTTEFEPLANGGTKVTLRFQPPKKAAQRKMFEQMGPMWSAGMMASADILRNELSTQMDDLNSERTEPALPKLKNADGFFGDIKPIRYVS